MQCTLQDVLDMEQTSRGVSDSGFTWTSRQIHQLLRFIESEFLPCCYSSSWCCPFLPAPLCSPLDWPQLSSRLCVMQGEHQLGRRNSGLHRGRLLLHTTPSLCRLFLVSFFATPVFSVFVPVFVSIFVSATLVPAGGGLWYTGFQVYV